MVQRNMPQGIGHILGDMFREAGAQVLYSADRDNDDTLAFFAHADGADVLRCSLLQPSPASFCCNLLLLLPHLRLLRSLLHFACFALAESNSSAAKTKISSDTPTPRSKSSVASKSPKMENSS